jgi:hypothetical protein
VSLSTFILGRFTTPFSHAEERDVDAVFEGPSQVLPWHIQLRSRLTPSCMFSYFFLVALRMQPAHRVGSYLTNKIFSGC